MTLNENHPVDQELNSTWPYWIRKLTTEINSVIESDSEITISDLVIATGSVLLDIGAELSSIKHETLLTTGVGAANIAQIRYGTEGQVKVFNFQDNNITFTAGAKTLGGIFLNQPLGSTINFTLSDIIVLQNVGGDGGESTDGYWEELYRKLSIR